MAAHLAGVAEDKVAILMLKMLIELHARPCLAQHRGERRLARLDPAQIDAVELEQVEGEQEDAGVRAPMPETIERWQPVVTAGHCLAVEQERADLSAEAASKICGYRSDQLWPFRVSSRTPAGSRRTIMR